jgi:oxygen-dependent protoporphyrinogen oxidase
VETAIVIGGGISGLTAGFRLREAGLQVKVLESADSVGGRMSSVRKDGYLIDDGASLLSSAYTRMQELITDAGLAGDIQPTSSVFGVLRDGHVHRMSSDSVWGAARTRLLSLRGKASAAKLILDALRGRGRLDYADFGRAADLDTESLSSYASRRVNPEVQRYLIEPITVGAFGVLPAQLSRVGFMFIMKNFIFGGGMFNSASGVGFLPQGLARGLDVSFGVQVRAVEHVGDAVEVTWRSAEDGSIIVENASGAVLAVPAPITLEIYQQLDRKQRELLAGIDYCPSITVSLGLTRQPDEECAMLLIPPCEYDGVLAVFFEHNKAPGRVPPGRGLVTVDWQGERSKQLWELDDAAIAAQTFAALQNALPRTFAGCALEMTHVRRWPHCLAIGGPGHYRSMKQLQLAIDPRSRVQLAGDYLGLSSTETAVCSGELAAERLIRTLTGSCAG